jgi:hypothetical protein
LSVYYIVIVEHIALIAQVYLSQAVHQF